MSMSFCELNFIDSVLGRAWTAVATIFLNVGFCNA